MALGERLGEPTDDYGEASRLLGNREIYDNQGVLRVSRLASIAHAKTGKWLEVVKAEVAKRGLEQIEKLLSSNETSRLTLPDEVYLPHAQGEEAQPVNLANLAIAGFAITDIPLPPALQAETGSRSVWPRPLLVLRGGRREAFSPSDVTNTNGGALIEYFSLGVNHIDDSWVLSRGWDNLVDQPGNGAAHLWVSGRKRVPVHLFPSKRLIRYSALGFNRAVDRVIETTGLMS